MLAQVGAHAAMRFAERLREIDLAPPHAGILRTVATVPGISQQQLAGLLGMVPSRLVVLLDELEGKRLIERRDHPDDRRLYALHLTDAGTKAMTDIGRVARAHEEALCASLDEGERTQLAELLGRVAEHQGLTAGVHPGFARMGGGGGAAGSAALPAASKPAGGVEPGTRKRKASSRQRSG